MALYSLGAVIDAGSNLAALREAFEIRTGERAASLFELGYINNAAAVPSLALSRSAVPGTGGTQLTFTPDDPNDPPSTTFAFWGTWSRVPTSPGIYIRRYAFTSGNQGGYVHWTFRAGLVIPPYSSLVLWNVSTTDPGGADVTCIIEE